MEWKLLTKLDNSWLLYINVLILLIITFLKVNFSFQLKEFSKLITNNKYILIFGKRDKFNFTFTFLLFVVQWITLWVSIYLLFKSTEFYSEVLFGYKTEYVIFLIVTMFVFCKILFQIVLGYIFEIKEIAMDYIFIKLSFSNYGGVLLFILNIINIYIIKISKTVLLLSLAVYFLVLLRGFVSYIRIKNNQLVPYIFYFILYFYALEVFPVLMIWYSVR